ncbi:MAG: plastocyanin/azurin family copper-binding protein [Dehalococcoidia bacterium]
MTTRRMRLAALAVSAAVLVSLAASAAACGGSDSASTDAVGVDSATPTPAVDAHQDLEGDELAVTVKTEQVRFVPAEIRVKVGQTVRLTLENLDPVLHDFTTEDTSFIVLESSGASHDMHGDDADAHGDDADAHGDDADAHDAEPDVHSTSEPSMTMKLHVAADANGTATLIFQATEPGEYVVYCTVEGHRLAGMEGKIIVEP